MPISWTSEADAKLFLGVLAQLKSANLKIDYKQLAQHMGPECTTSAAKQRVGKLRRDAEGSQISGDGNTTTESGVSPTRGQKRKSADCGGRKTGAVKVPKIEETLKDELGIDVTDIIKPKGVKKEEE